MRKRQLRDEANAVERARKRAKRDEEVMVYFSFSAYEKNRLQGGDRIYKIGRDKRPKRKKDNERFWPT